MSWECFFITLRNVENVFKYEESEFLEKTWTIFQESATKELFWSSFRNHARNLSKKCWGCLVMRKFGLFLHSSQLALHLEQAIKLLAPYTENVLNGLGFLNKKRVSSWQALWELIYFTLPYLSLTHTVDVRRREIWMRQKQKHSCVEILTCSFLPVLCSSPD